MTYITFYNYKNTEWSLVVFNDRSPQSKQEASPQLVEPI